MKKIIKQILILACLLTIIVLPYFVFAQNTAPLENLEKVGEGGGYAEASPTTVSEIAGTAIGAVLSLLGVVFIILIIYGGFLWMTDQGNEEQVTKAKTIIRNSIIGLIIVVSAYAIYKVVNILFDRALL